MEGQKNTLEKKAKSKVATKKNIPIIAILIVSSCIALYAGVQLFTISQSNEDAKEYYATLRENVISKDKSIDFSKLKEENEDVIAWLSLQDVNDGYPVMRADNYSYYLDYLPNGTMNSNGALFFDIENESDLSEKLITIYGKDISNGSMFGFLKKYKKQGFYDRNPVIEICSENGTYEVQLLYGADISGKQWRDRGFTYGTNLKGLLSYAKSNTTFISNASYTDDDRFLVLSTCKSSFEGKRYFVIGVI